MSADLAATVAALKDGDRVRATFVYDEATVIAEGTLREDSFRDLVVGRNVVRRYLASGNRQLTAVEVLPPALPPEPRVGCGVFHDGRLWVRGLDGRWYGVIDRMWEPRTWAEIQPCVPAVPADEWGDTTIAYLLGRRDATAPLSTDEPDVPVGSVAVFRRSNGSLCAPHRGDMGWSGTDWSYWTGLYGTPVAVIPAGGE